MELGKFLACQSSHDPELKVDQYLTTGVIHADGNENVEDKCLAARLCADTIELFQWMIQHLSTQADVPKDVNTSLRRSYSRLKLWSDGYGISQGKLDHVFAKSWKIRRATLKILASIGRALAERMC